MGPVPPTAELFIDTCEWESYVPEGQPHTYQRVSRRKTVGEVHDELRQALGTDEHSFVTYPGLDEYFSPLKHVEWPRGRIAVFAVTGSSEGDYVHVEVLHDDGTYTCVILGKTFQGRDAAWGAARRIADLLGV